ncbi:MAG: hypothetical protein WD773_04885 [Gemmatimonadales bacterium]
MPADNRLAVLLDGEFVKKTLGKRLKRFPTHADVMSGVKRILAEPSLAECSLYRVFYYTAEPLTGIAIHPLDGTRIDFARTPVFSWNRQLIAKVENEPDVADLRPPLTRCPRRA